MEQQRRLNVRWNDKKGDLWIIPYVICRWFPTHPDQLSLVSVAYIALDAARRLYNPEKSDASFSSYAIKCVMLSVKRHINEERSVSYVEKPVGDDADDLRQVMPVNGHRVDCEKLIDMAKLSIRHEECVKMHYCEDRTYSFISRKMGVTRQCVNTIVSRSVAKMRKIAVRDKK